jgi:cell division protein FtsW (lipid II flippase)
MEAENFSEQDSLKLINEMIGKAKKSYITKGTASIVWGIIIFLCSIINWSEQHFKYNFPFDIWLLTLVALILQVYFSIKENRSRQFVSYEGIVIQHTWIAFSASIFILSFYLARHSQNGQSATLIMMLYGIPTYITGGVTKFKPMIFGGVFCWVASFISIYTSIEIDLLLIAVCGLFAWLIPGVILWNRYQKGKKENV